MKFESLIMAALFAACFSACASVMGAMLVTTPASVRLAHADKAAAVAMVAPASCALPPGNATCSRAND